MDVLCPQFSLIQNYKLLSYSCNLVFVSLTIDFFQNFSQFLVWMLENSEEQWTAMASILGNMELSECEGIC